MRKLVTVRQASNVRNHPNADALDLVEIGGRTVIFNVALLIFVLSAVTMFIPLEDTAEKCLVVDKRVQQYNGSKGRVTLKDEILCSDGKVRNVTWDTYYHAQAGQTLTFTSDNYMYLKYQDIYNISLVVSFLAIVLAVIAF